MTREEREEGREGRHGNWANMAFADDDEMAVIIAVRASLIAQPRDLKSCEEHRAEGETMQCFGVSSLGGCIHSGLALFAQLNDLVSVDPSNEKRGTDLGLFFQSELLVNLGTLARLIAVLPRFDPIINHTLTSPEREKTDRDRPGPCRGRAGRGCRPFRPCGCWSRCSTRRPACWRWTAHPLNRGRRESEPCPLRTASGMARPTRAGAGPRPRCG